MCSPSRNVPAGLRHFVEALGVLFSRRLRCRQNCPARRRRTRGGSPSRPRGPGHRTPRCFHGPFTTSASINRAGISGAGQTPAVRQHLRASPPIAAQHRPPRSAFAPKSIMGGRQCFKSPEDSRVSARQFRAHSRRVAAIDWGAFSPTTVKAARQARPARSPPQPHSQDLDTRGGCAVGAGPCVRTQQTQLPPPPGWRRP